MPNRRRLFAAIFLATALAGTASAHSLQELEDQLFANEKFFQPVDVPAPSFTLRDAQGIVVDMTDFRGKVVVLYFIYTHCPDVCPLQSEKVAGIQRLVNLTPMKGKVAFVAISTDPKRDQGATLSDYGVAHGLDPGNWSFLTAGPDQAEDATRKLAKSYGSEFTSEGDGVEVHGVVTHVIDQRGRMLARFHGLDFDPANLVLFVNALTNNLQDHRHEAELGLWSKINKLFR